MDEFERELAEACTQAMSVMLGASTVNAVLWHLKQLGVTEADCGRRPREFDDALSTIFNPIHALFIEAHILRRFYKTRNEDFRWGDLVDFGAEVKLARRRYDDQKAGHEK